MLKKMQRRFIMAAMAAFATVMLVLVAGINIGNYYRTTLTQDGLAASLLEYEQRAYERREHRNTLSNEKTKEHERRISAHLDPDFPPISEMPGGGPEARFTTRFFAVYCDIYENIEVISRDYIYSIDEETAKAYTVAVLQKGKEKGYYGDYRYHVKINDAGSTIFKCHFCFAVYEISIVYLVSNRSFQPACCLDTCYFFLALCSQTLHKKYGASETVYYGCRARVKNTDYLHRH